MSRKIQRIRLMRPLVLTGHEHPEQLNVDTDENLSMEEADRGILLKWTDIQTKEVCESFVPLHNVIQIIFKPYVSHIEPFRSSGQAESSKMLDVKPGPGRPKKNN